MKQFLVPKGSYGYINNRKKYTALRTVLFFAISAALYISGIMKTGSNKNLLTIVAVLGCLPACKSAVNFILFLRAKGCSDALHKKLVSYDDALTVFYDMYFTSYQKNFAVSHMVVENRIVLGYTEDSKCDTAACVTHLKTMLSQAGFSDVTVTITDKLDKYCGQLRMLNEKSAEGSPEKDDEIRVALYEISL